MSFQRLTQIPTKHSPHTFTPLAPPSFPSHPGSSVLTDCRPEGLLTVDKYPHRWISKEACRLCRRQLITFNTIPDDVLLEIFGFCVLFRIREWIRLAHVCRRWRSVVFHSPLRLNLQLVCTPKTPTRDMVNIWPSLPLIIRDFNFIGRVEPYIEDNIIAALEHNDRICQIRLRDIESGYLTKSAAILKPFPELTELELRALGPDPILPDSFLGGSAPRLRSLKLNKVPFPALPKLLLSSAHLVHLELTSVPRFGYILPEIMATSLSALTGLESLWLCFDYPPPRPPLETRRPPLPPLTRSILLSLIRFIFKGASEYLETILSRIDAPRLDFLDITFFSQLIFDTPQLFQFISRRPTLMTQEMGLIVFSSTHINVGFPFDISYADEAPFSVGIRCAPSEWQLSSLEQLCISSLPPVPMLETLYISEPEYGYDGPYWQDDVQTTLWLDLLRPFVAVKKFYISKKFVPRIAPALQELVGGRTTEVLPALENIFLERFQPSSLLQEGIETFVAARLLTSHPVTVSCWDRNWIYDSELESDAD